MTDIQKIISALKPFAEAAEGLDPSDEDGWLMWEHPQANCVSVGDFRRAAESYAALEAASTDGDGMPEVTNDMIAAAMDAADGWFEIDEDKGAWLRSQGWEAAFKAMYTLVHLSPAPASKVGHTGPNGGRLSAPDLAHRFVAETYGYQPQDPMARYLRERFTEYIEIDRAMAPASRVENARREALEDVITIMLNATFTKTHAETLEAIRNLIPGDKP